VGTPWWPKSWRYREHWQRLRRKVPGSLILIDAIKSAIDDYADREMGNRDFFYGGTCSIGPRKHT